MAIVLAVALWLVGIVAASPHAASHLLSPTFIENWNSGCYKPVDFLPAGPTREQAIAPSASAHGVSNPSLIRGASMEALPTTVELNTLLSMNSSHTRLYLHWKYMQPALPAIEPNLSVALLRARPDLVYQWAATVPNWSLLDAAVARVHSAQVTIIGEVGEGTIEALPALPAALYPKSTPADPSILGTELYLAYIYRCGDRVCLAHPQLCARHCSPLRYQHQHVAGCLLSRSAIITTSHATD